MVCFTPSWGADLGQPEAKLLPDPLLGKAQPSKQSALPDLPLESSLQTLQTDHCGGSNSVCGN